MPRETSEHVVGEYWLDKRRDGKAPDIWQIATYKPPPSRSVVYRSTHKRSLDEAKAVLDAFYVELRSTSPQEPQDATVIPLLTTYWKEHGRKAVKPDQIASSLRQFIGFLMQDKVTQNAVVTDLTPALFERFREWRMGPHSYSVPWGGKDYDHSSPGVKGESVQRNLDDVRAAINHAEANHRLPLVPKIAPLPRRYRSGPRERLLSWQELGAVYGYARSFPELYEPLALILATAARPEVAWGFTAAQYDDEHGLIDLHSPDKPVTNKRNPILPAIEPVKPILREWKARPVLSRKKRWRTMRRVLGLSADVIPKTIRHTIATRLRADRTVPRDMIGDLLGHTMRGVTGGYAKYDPEYMRELIPALTTIWDRVMDEADKWAADHSLTKHGRTGKLEIAFRGEKPSDLGDLHGVGGQGLEPRTLSV